MDLFEKRMEIINKLKTYFIRNMVAMEREFNISVPKNIITMSNMSFVAWVQVRATKILMAKDVKECEDLKDLIVEFVKTEQEVEIAETCIILSQQCM